MSRRSKRKQSSNALPLAVIGIVLLIGAVFIYKYVKVVQNTIETDSKNCRSDGLYPRDSVILIDATQRTSEAQLEDLSNQLEKIIRDSLLYERFTVYFLRDDPERFQPRIVVCNPGTGEGLDPNTNNLRKLMNKWQNSFKTPIKESIDGLSEVTPSTSSPIMEMLKFVGLRTFSRSTASDKRLILISDMVEHTDSYSQYRNLNLDFESLSQTAFFREKRPRLNGVMINLLYIERPELSTIQGTKHITKFWQPFMRNSGGQINDVTYVN